MNKSLIFVGTSISMAEAKEICPTAICLPPAKRADILKAIELKPLSILLIDGVFGTQPSVQHKELLFALEMGITVYGAASMGALRAAELSTFGMIGIGKIFEDYKSEIITDDDEVALIYDPISFKPVNEALVDIRATIKNAINNGIISIDNANLIIQSAKMLHYKNRTLKHAIKEVEKSIDTSIINDFIIWYQNGGYVNQKRIDAKKALHVLQDSSSNARSNLTFKMNKTIHFEKLLRDSQCEPPLFYKSSNNQEYLDNTFHKYCKKLALLLECYCIGLGKKIEDCILKDSVIKIEELLFAFDNIKVLKYSYQFKYYQIASNIVATISDVLQQRGIYPSSASQQQLMNILMRAKSIKNTDELVGWLDFYHIKNSKRSGTF